MYPANSQVSARHLGKVVLVFMWVFSTTECVSLRVLTVYTSINAVYSKLTLICISIIKSSQALRNICRWKENCWLSTFCSPAVYYDILFGMATEQQDKCGELSMAARNRYGPHFSKVRALSTLHWMRGAFAMRVSKCSPKLYIQFLQSKEMKWACSAVSWVSRVVMRKQNSGANRGFLTFLTPPGYSQLVKGRKAVAQENITRVSFHKLQMGI